MRGPGATAVGSLPHRDPVEAAELVLRALPDLPAAPQLPNRAAGELMLSQAADGLAGVTVTADGALDVDRDTLGVADVATFGDACWDGLLTFLRLTKDREGPVKLQLTGPVTLAVALVRGGAHANQAIRVASDAVRLRAAALLDMADNDQVVLCLDEPAMADAHPAIAVEDVVVDVVEGFAPTTVGGVHCCGDADWDTVLSRLPVNAVASIPLAAVPAAATAHFLARGGTVAWGAVPTTPPYVTDADDLWERLRPVLRDVINSGCTEDAVRTQSWITPECGLAGLTEAVAEDALIAAGRLAAYLDDRDL